MITVRRGLLLRRTGVEESTFFRLTGILILNLQDFCGLAGLEMGVRGVKGERSIAGGKLKTGPGVLGTSPSSERVPSLGKVIRSVPTVVS